MQKFKYYDAIGIAFIICLITSNLAATKLWQVGSLTVPGGMIIFPLLYVFNDIITEVYGFSASRRVIWVALFSNLFLTVTLYVVTTLQPSVHSVNHEAFSSIFSLTPKIFIASIISYFIGELLNSSVISTLKIMLEGKHFAMRAIFSTCFGAFVETTIFASIAFGDRMPMSALVSMIFTMSILKVLYEIMVLPISVQVTSILKRVESVDSFERPSLRGVFGMRASEG